MNRKEEIEKMAWIISGAPGSGKMTTARQIASTYLDACSDPKVLQWDDMKNVFAVGAALSNSPAVVIVEGVPSPPPKAEWSRMKALTTEEKIVIERKGRDRELVAAPVFIFVLTGDDRYFVGCRHFRLVILP